MTGKKTKIRLRILTVFSIMLFFSFSLIGIVFNLIARQYIQMIAVSQLDATYSNMMLFMDQAEIFIERQGVRPSDFPPLDFSPLDNWHDSPYNYSARRNALQISSNVFIIDDDYNLPFRRDNSDEVREIVQAVKETETNLTSLKNLQLKTDDSIFYISAFQAPDNQLVDRSYFIIYADVTGISSFASRINTILILLVCIMFVITVIVTFILSKSITRPIEKLSVFASKIGHGDFTQNDFSFKDEEFEKLNIALNNSAKQLSIYDSEQKTFFQNVSHELRTPLMSIQCHAEGISFNLMDPVKASETIVQETQRLSSLVTDLLYISKIDNITRVYEGVKTDLLEIIRSCARRQQLVAEKKGIRFTFDFIDPSIDYECAGELISRAIDNLISNAIRYASAEIILSCKKDHHQITICISDDGCGIEPESMPHIFERFYKSNSGNHGIGLSIVKSIVEQYQGNITAKNKLNSGAEFTIVLPLRGRK